MSEEGKKATDSGGRERQRISDGGGEMCQGQETCQDPAAGSPVEDELGREDGEKGMAPVGFRGKEMRKL